MKDSLGRLADPAPAPVVAAPAAAPAAVASLELMRARGLRTRPARRPKATPVAPPVAAPVVAAPVPPEPVSFTAMRARDALGRPANPAASPRPLPILFSIQPAPLPPSTEPPAPAPLRVLSYFIVDGETGEPLELMDKRREQRATEKIRAMGFKA